MTLLYPIISVLTGFLIAYAIKPKNMRHLKLVLAFSGAFLLAVTVFNFLPIIYKSSSKHVGLFIMAGILLQICLEFFSKGAEHGHLHLNKNSHKFPWLLFISLCIHALLEGIPVHSHTSLLYGIVVHKLPIAIILSVFFLASKINNFKIGFFLIIFGLMTPLGMYLSKTSSFLNHFYIELSAISIGIFLHISTTILFESNENHSFNLTKLVTIIIAVILAYFI